MNIDLSPDQVSAYAQLLEFANKFYRDSDLLTMGGYAGAGKTTLLSLFAREFEGLAAYSAYTGRASSVLARKLRENNIRTTNKTLLSGIYTARTPLSANAAKVGYRACDPEAQLGFAGTIHRLLYRPIIDERTEELKGWEKRQHLDRHYKLIIVDEASMVSDEILADLQAHSVPILAVGDHGQLAPVRATSNLMQSPDIRLEQIHRQAAKSPIILLSKIIRMGGLMRDIGAMSGDAIRFERKAEVERVLEELYTTPTGAPTRAVTKGEDILDVALDAVIAERDLGNKAILCWTNRMRIKLNAHARRIMGFKGAPKLGEQLICLRNKPPIYNGMRGVLTTDLEPTGVPWKMRGQIAFPEEGIGPHAVEFNISQFNRERTFASLPELHELGINVSRMADAGDLYDFGYACTVHKYQGSQAAHVVFYPDRPEEPESDDWRRFAYTAVTRASERLTVMKSS